jgi:hypothetical protein
MPLSGPTPSSEPETQPDSQLIASIATIAELLQDVTLTIPSYQRPYRWDVENVSQLIADIQRFRPSGHYRLGTVILYTGDGDDGTETRRSEIVDGQQRYLTFAVIAHAITEVPRLADVKLAERLRNAVQHIQLPGRRDGQTQLNLRRNFAQVRNVVTRWSGIEIEEFARFFLDDCSVIVLKVADLDAAFQMFDSQNTRGRALYPTDLLKAYHLREFSQTDPGTAQLLEVVKRWESVPSAEINHLIAAVLFPIKRWTSHQPLPRKGFSSDYIGLFKGVRQGTGGNGQFRWARLPLLAQTATDRFAAENRALIQHGVVDELTYPFQLTQPVVDGEMFFAMVDHYVAEARRIGIRWQGASDKELRTRAPSPSSELAPLLEILDDQPPGAGNRYVRELFDCLLLAYVDRFGWHHTREAAFALAQHAYLLRIRMARIAMPSVDTHALEAHYRASAVRVNLFSTLAYALDPDVIFTLRIPRPSTDDENNAAKRGLAPLFGPDELATWEASVTQ